MVPPRRGRKGQVKPTPSNNANVMPQAKKEGPRPLIFKGRGLIVSYSHSIVPTGFGVRSYSTRHTPDTSFKIRPVIF